MDLRKFIPEVTEFLLRRSQASGLAAAGFQAGHGTNASSRFHRNY